MPASSLQNASLIEPPRQRSQLTWLLTNGQLSLNLCITEIHTSGCMYIHRSRYSRMHDSSHLVETDWMLIKEGVCVLSQVMASKSFLKSVAGETWVDHCFLIDLERCGPLASRIGSRLCAEIGNRVQFAYSQRASGYKRGISRLNQERHNMSHQQIPMGGFTALENWPRRSKVAHDFLVTCVPADTTVMRVMQ